MRSVPVCSLRLVTDGQTDRQTDRQIHDYSIYRASIASRAKIVSLIVRF